MYCHVGVVTEKDIFAGKVFCFLNYPGTTASEREASRLSFHALVARLAGKTHMAPSPQVWLCLLCDGNGDTTGMLAHQLCDLHTGGGCLPYVDPH